MTIDLQQLVLGPCMATFGEVNQSWPAPLYIPASAAPYTMSGGIFDPSYTEMKLDQRTGVTITIKLPVLGCREIDFVGYPEQGDRIKLRGITYDVREVRADGHGGIKLMLNVSAETA